MAHLRELLRDCSEPSLVDLRDATRADLERLSGDRRLTEIRSVDHVRTAIEETLGSEPHRSRVLSRQQSRTSDGAGNLENERRLNRSQSLSRHFEVSDAPADPRYGEMARETDVHERAAELPYRAHMYDDTAYVSVDFDDSRAGAYRIDHPGFVEDLHQVFTVMWLRSSPKYEPAPADNALVLIRMLDSGLPDEAAAARLGVSVRTYRRRVSELLAGLSVSTRFAAGRVAERRGLLDLAEIVQVPDWQVPATGKS